METLTTDENGAIINLSNFRKLYKYYNDIVFEGNLTKLNRENKFYMSNWHILNQTNAPRQISRNSYAIYDIRNGSVVLYNIVDKLPEIRTILGISDNTQLLKYLVEELILDQLYLLNVNTYNTSDPMLIKQHLNNIYFKHNIILPTSTSNGGVIATLSLNNI